MVTGVGDGVKPGQEKSFRFIFSSLFFKLEKHVKNVFLCESKDANRRHRQRQFILKPSAKVLFQTF
jgi:hypothetical protein